MSALALRSSSSPAGRLRPSVLICYCCFLTDGPICRQICSFQLYRVFDQKSAAVPAAAAHVRRSRTPVGGLWEQPSGSKLLPRVPADVPAWTGSDGPSERRGKVRVTRWVKLDPSGRLARPAGRQGLFQLGLTLAGGGITTEFTERETGGVTGTQPEVKPLKSDRPAS